MTMVVEDTGSGFPVLMLHGLGGTSNTFQPLMRAAPSCRVVRPDMPGSGRSPMVQGRLSVASMAEAVMVWLRGAGIDRFGLVGHSMGTLVCQRIAALLPDKVAGMVLFGALTEPPDAARDGLLKRAAIARQDGMAGIADQIVENTLASSAHEENPAAVAFVRESILRQPPEGYARNCEALSAAEVAEWGRITAPTLLVTGESDPVAPVSMARLLGEKIDGARTEVIPRCGHWTPLEKPRESAGFLQGFLAQHMH
jgi:pimeloyl-ACP methyl ester carboxylesterase